MELGTLLPTVESLERSEVSQSQEIARSPTYEIVHDVDLPLCFPTYETVPDCDLSLCSSTYETIHDVDLFSLHTAEIVCPEPDVYDDRSSLEHSGSETTQSLVTASVPTYETVVDDNLHSLCTTDCRESDVDDDVSSEISVCYEGADIVCAPSSSVSVMGALAGPSEYSYAAQPSKGARSDCYVIEGFHNLRLPASSNASTSLNDINQRRCQTTITASCVKKLDKAVGT